MDDKLNMIINTMRMATRDNTGVIIEPLGVDEGVLTIKYYEGTNPDCPECIMQPDSFKEMVLRLCQIQAPYISEVQVIPAR